MSPFFGTFHHFSLQNSDSRFFLKNPALSVFFNYPILTPCKKLEKFNDGKYEKKGNGLTNILRYSSTEVENCNVLFGLVSTSVFSDFSSLLRLLRRLKSSQTYQTDKNLKNLKLKIEN